MREKTSIFHHQSQATTSPNREGTGTQNNPRNNPSLSPEDFDFFRELIQVKAGIHIPRNKSGLIETRLGKRIEALGLQNYAQYKSLLKRDVRGKECEIFINNLTTNKTDFFREKYHFEYLTNHLKKRPTRGPVMIWSAACSSGEEAYSLAIICHELTMDHPGFEYRILGTDIDSERLLMSKQGIFDAKGNTNLSLHYQKKYFQVSGDRTRSKIRVRESLRHHVKFRQHNLVNYEDRLPLRFDVIFLRNVLFYFTQETGRKIVDKLIDQLEPGGLLFISKTETLPKINYNLRHLHSSIYQKRLGS